MAGGDVQFKIPNGEAPTAKIIDGVDSLIPKSVNATFDGTGAGSAFLPCLIITGKEGFEVARIPAPQVAAGASAEVSWFPRVGGSVSAAGTSAREQLQSNAPTSIPSNNGDWLDWNHLDGVSLLDLTTPQFPLVKAAGVYAITTTVFVDPMTAGARYYHQLSAGTPGFPEVVQSSGEAVAADPQPFTSCAMTSQLRANQPLFAYVYNFDSVPRDFGLLRAIVQKVS